MRLDALTVRALLRGVIVDLKLMARRRFRRKAWTLKSSTLGMTMNHNDMWALADIVTLVAIRARRGMKQEPVAPIIADSIDAWRQASAAFLTAEHITPQERFDARTVAVKFVLDCMQEQ